jgi:predicted phage tail protein
VFVCLCVCVFVCVCVCVCVWMCVCGHIHIRVRACTHTHRKVTAQRHPQSNEKKKISHTGSHGEGTKAYEQPVVPVQLFDVSFFFLVQYLTNAIQTPTFQEKHCIRSPISLISSGLSLFAGSLLNDSTTYLLYLIYYW